jgi:hypothetical protein
VCGTFMSELMWIIISIKGLFLCKAEEYECKRPYLYLGILDLGIKLSNLNFLKSQIIQIRLVIIITSDLCLDEDAQ